MCDKAIKKWREAGPRPLNDGPWEPDGTKKKNPGTHNSGVWLFTDRNNITDFIAPNFPPPYDTPNKKQIILAFLKDTWDEDTLSWKKCEKASVQEPHDTVIDVTRNLSAFELTRNLSAFVFPPTPNNSPPRIRDADTLNGDDDAETNAATKAGCFG